MKLLVLVAIALYLWSLAAFALMDEYQRAAHQNLSHDVNSVQELAK